MVLPGKKGSFFLLLAFLFSFESSGTLLTIQNHACWDDPTFVFHGLAAGEVLFLFSTALESAVFFSSGV